MRTNRQNLPGRARQNERWRGATLLHMLCIIATLGMLSAVLFPRFVNHGTTAKADLMQPAAADSAPSSFYNQNSMLSREHDAFAYRAWLRHQKRHARVSPAEFIQ